MVQTKGKRYESKLNLYMMLGKIDEALRVGESPARYRVVHKADELLA